MVIFVFLFELVRLKNGLRRLFLIQNTFFHANIACTALHKLKASVHTTADLDNLAWHLSSFVLISMLSTLRLLQRWSQVILFVIPTRFLLHLALYRLPYSSTVFQAWRVLARCHKSLAFRVFKSCMNLSTLQTNEGTNSFNYHAAMFLLATSSFFLMVRSLVLRRASRSQLYIRFFQVSNSKCQLLCFKFQSRSLSSCILQETFFKTHFLASRKSLPVATSTLQRFTIYFYTYL